MRRNGSAYGVVPDDECLRPGLIFARQVADIFLDGSVLPDGQVNMKIEDRYRLGAALFMVLTSAIYLLLGGH